MVANFFIDPLNSICETLYRYPFSGDFQFSERVNLFGISGRILRDGLRDLLNYRHEGGQASFSNVQLNELQESLIFNLVESVVQHPTNESHKQNYKELKRVALIEEYIVTNTDKPITREDLADLSNISIRTLSWAFKRIHGVGPMEMLRNCRLDRIYEELRFSNPADHSISKLAHYYGFFELGKFSASFKARFGELPSQVLRKNPRFHAPKTKKALQNRAPNDDGEILPC